LERLRRAVRLWEVRVCAASGLRRDDEPLVPALLEEAPDERLAAAVAIDVGCVQEGHARVDGGVQDGQRVALVDLPPVGTELPAPQPDDADLLARPAQHPGLHVHRP
jgi:hypothetical protein